ncbi:hypothetical protein P153DRAFT_392826 [Dothidotthia symphoricarpi CBS 119687]|uniref:Uncharacterized protein n=1 Tax=Dothidotthia symphoricarpi CBS 119687 TaxID=1392245 RepID=A0A6A6AUK3_9PLEO|nr:uncharacterized protein P153DRAFT_392826 [Dothidotthia symphoricarpi CBS 119687]KAF2134221.1 hypothetical protein P153DRAFT_392826 [Dothidotthia symphoricarpi CBS 119687]
MGFFSLSKSRRKPNDMGDDQGAAQYNRLSKPKTNTNTHGPTLYLDSSASAYSRHAETILPPSDKESTCLNKEAETREPVAHVRGRSSVVVSRSNSLAKSRSNSLSCFSGRGLSVNQLPGPPVLDSSSASGTQMDVEAAIRLLQEVKKNASPEDLAALHAALGSSTDNAIPDEPQLSHQTSLANLSSSSLTRRRSLIQTPGVATRTTPVEDNRNRWKSWKAPKVDTKEEAKWRPSPSLASPKKPLTALDLVEDDNGASTLRAQTPGDTDYCQLGTFKLGTLAVINGEPSPAPSTRTTKQMPYCPAQVDYFSVANSSVSSQITANTNNRSHERSKSSVLPTTPPLYRGLEVPNNERRTRSNLRHNITTKPVENHPTNSSSQPEDTRRVKTSHKTVETPQHAITLAQEYQVGIPSTPFRRDSESKDMKGHKYFAPELPPRAENAAHVLDGAMCQEPSAMVATSNPADVCKNNKTTISQRRRKQAAGRPPARTADTADSGYSSGGSLRLAREETRKSRLSTISATAPTSPQNEDVVNVQQKTSPVTSILKVPSVNSRYSLLADEERPASMQISAELLDATIPHATSSPKSPQSATSLGSQESASSKSQKRLQKRRPSQAQLPMVQSGQAIREGKDSEIPEVPGNIRAKFTRRLSQTPGIECLTSTFASTEHVIANEVVHDLPDSTPTESVNKLALIELRPTPASLARRKSLSFFRRRKSFVGESEASKEEPVPSLTVLDLGTIASSLGCSPYDAAMSDLPRRQSVTSPTHPHQLGSATSRTKPMVSMDAATAAELARLRSRDRASAEPEMPQRRRKSHHNLKQEASEGKDMKHRSRSSRYDVPPVPLINTARLSVPTKAMSKLPSEDRKMQNLDASSHVLPPQPVFATTHVYDAQYENRHNASQQDVNWEAQSRHWGQQRRKSMGEGLRTQAKTPEISDATVNFRTTQISGEPMTWDRYTGGLDFGYEGRGALGGSAGTRHGHSHASSKSMQWKNQYGVDLSDVPIFLQRA